MDFESLHIWLRKSGFAGCSRVGPLNRMFPYAAKEILLWLPIIPQALRETYDRNARLYNIMEMSNVQL